MIWRHFKLGEFTCRHCGVNLIDHQFVTELDDLRHHLGFALPITSGYRCPEYNAQVSLTGRNGRIRRAGPLTSASRMRAPTMSCRQR